MLSSYDITVPPDFLLLSSQAMRHLQSCERSNVVYGLAKGLGEIRQDHSDSRFPARRMPMGLIEYAVGFFNADVIQHVSISIARPFVVKRMIFVSAIQVPCCPPDYRQWLSSMYSLFGSKWSKLHSGPLWSVEQLMQGSEGG